MNSINPIEPSSTTLGNFSSYVSITVRLVFEVTKVSNYNETISITTIILMVLTTQETRILSSQFQSYFHSLE